MRNWIIVYAGNLVGSLAVVVFIYFIPLGLLMKNAVKVK